MYLFLKSIGSTQSSILSIVFCNIAFGSDVEKRGVSPTCGGALVYVGMVECEAFGSWSVDMLGLARYCVGLE